VAVAQSVQFDCGLKPRNLFVCLEVLFAQFDKNTKNIIVIIIIIIIFVVVVFFVVVVVVVVAAAVVVVVVETRWRRAKWYSSNALESSLSDSKFMNNSTSRHTCQLLTAS
jgi:chromate transport protein ChrA